MKRHMMRSLLVVMGLLAVQVGADENGTAASSGSSTDVGEVEPGADGTISVTEPAPLPEGEDAVVSGPGPEPGLEISPEEDELIAYRAELAERVEAGELTWNEAAVLFEEMAASLGFDRDPVDERILLLEDFREELDIQVRAGDLTPDEAEAQLIDFMIELGLIEVSDGRPVEPGPSPMPQSDPETALKRFTGMLEFLAEYDALTAEQVREQVAAFASFLEAGEDVPLPHPDMNLSMDQAELVYIAREFSLWYTPDEFDTDDLNQELLFIAGSLDIIEVVGVTPVEPEPDPNQERLLALREDLNRQVEEGRITEEDARQLFYEAAEELGLIDEDGTVVILPTPGAPPTEPSPMPPEYQPSPSELEMMELLRELAVLIEQGEMTRDEAWERLAATAVEEGWDIDFGMPDSSPEPASGEDADASGVLITLRSDLESRVEDAGLSGSDAWDELTRALDSQQEAAADGQVTAVRAATWGSVKASVR